MGRAFLDRLQQGPVLCDGAMGTELYARADVAFLDYIQAGAEVIDTNTFGANRVRLAGHGLQDRVWETNQAAVAVAREARRLTGQHVWIAGSIGPLGRPLAPVGPISPAHAREVFQEQAAALAEAGADLLILETFGDLREVREAVLAARAACDLPIVAQMTFTEEGRTPAGDVPADIVRTLEGLGVAAVGANCSVGSEPMLRVMEEMAQVARVPLAAQPNAGFPAYVGGRFIYLASPEYMARHARRMVEVGVSLVGGCCGTTPRHIAAMRDALRGVQVGRRPPSGVVVRERAVPAAQPPPEPTGLAQRLGRKFVVTVEADPPKGFDVSGYLLALQTLKRLGYVDAINVADSPRAQARMSALAMCVLIQTRLGLETILHLTTRHRNLVAIHSELLGAHALGVRNIFCVMGDLPRVGDYPSATAVADITASGLMALLGSFNQGRDVAGKPIGQSTAFLIGGAFNLSAADADRELKVLERKLRAGVHFLLTQPVWDPEVVARWEQRLGGRFPVPVLLGVLPLRSSRHAEFLHHEVPGMVVPQEVRQRMREAGDRAPELGVALVRELLQAVHGRVAGAYVMPPFGHFDVVAQLLEGLDIPNLYAPPPSVPAPQGGEGAAPGPG